MSDELSILALYGLFVSLVIVVQVLLAWPQVGLSYLASPRDEGDKLSGVAARSLRAVNNCIAAMALFAPAVLLLAVQDAFTGQTLLAAQAFLVARILYVPLFMSGIPWLRTGVWTVGFLATVYLYMAAI